MYDLVIMADRQVLTEDSRVLREAALRGSVYIRWPDDRPWLEHIEGIGDPLRRLQGMKERGSLASIARGRWIVMPPGHRPSLKPPRRRFCWPHCSMGARSGISGSSAP
jgi:hypothetical protein